MLKDEEREAGIIKDFAAVAILNDIDDKAADFMCAFIRSLSKWNIKADLAKTVEKFNKDRNTKQDIDYHDWHK